MKKRVYLAGPIFGTGEKSRSWRKVAMLELKRYGMEVVDPYDLEADINNEEELVRADLKEIAGCQFILAQVSNASWGTAMELFYAKGLGIKIFGWGLDTEHQDLSPWLRWACHSISSDMIEAATNLVNEALDDE